MTNRAKNRNMVAVRMLNINKGLRGGSSHAKHEQRVISTMVAVRMLDTKLFSVMVTNRAKNRNNGTWWQFAC